MKQGDRERREWLSEQRSALALAASEEGQWEWSIATGEMFVSERAQRLLGLEPAARVRPRSEWLERVRWHPEDEARWRAELEAFLAGSGAHYEGEWRVLHPDGGFRWIRGRTACLRSAAGRAELVLGSLLDIQAQKSAEALAGGIAHDFNNILGAILGYGEMALRDVPRGSRLRRDLDAIMLAGERGRRLVDRILAFSRSSPGERAPVHVEAVVREALDLQPALEGDTESFDVACGDRQCVLVIDDEEPLMRLTTETLSELGYSPVGFTSSEAALMAFKAGPDTFDAVITDERMPGLSGTALIRELRGLRRKLPILLVSGYLGGATVIHARDAGADEILKKPLSARELATSLARVLSAR